MHVGTIYKSQLFCVY